jgi:hypothetical protein
VTAPTADDLREALHPLLVAAGWAPSGGATFRRGNLSLTIGHRELDLDEVSADDSPDGPVEVLHAVVSTVTQAVAYLRVAGALTGTEGWQSQPPCILCGRPAARGLRHCPSCQPVLDRVEPGSVAR